jgi:hypothetical protein
MVRIERIRKVVAVAEGAQQVIADLQASTAAELPALNGVVEGCKILAGSIAQVIQESKWMTLDANGTWYASGTEG